MKHRFAVLVVLVLVTSSLVGGFLGGKASAVSSPAQNSPNEFIQEFTEAIDVIQKNHMDDISADKLIYSAIRSMLRTLDPHSSFFDPQEFSRLQEDQRSKYYGLGIRVRKLMPWSDRGRVVIVEPPVIGSPADKRGLRAGDVITNISGQNIDDWTQDEIVDHLRGPLGTKVDITVERPGVHNPLQFTVEREEIPVINVPYAFEVKPGIGYIKINTFAAETTADELKRSLDKLGANKLSGLIIDLRDNPGGLLNQAIDVTDLFIPKGEMVVSTKGRLPSTNRSYTAPSLEKIRVPLVVLINNRSASASEIVAGALQDHDRALIVGETSFGKGLVQSVYATDSNTGMALTTARYYTPSGRLIQRDYSGSAFDYYNLPDVSASENKKREVKTTDSGRQVLGGGGITPDVPVPSRELNRFETILASRYLFFEYARRLASGQVPAASTFHLPTKDEVKSPAQRAELAAASKFEVTGPVLDDFMQFLRSEKVEFTDQDISDNVEFIKRGIKQEVFDTAFGLEEGWRVAIQGDTQVQKAIELMPEAKMLMTTGHFTLVAQAPTIKK